MGALLEQQRRFARALSGDLPAAVSDVVPSGRLAPEARLSVYANNTRLVFEEAVRQTYPVLACRVGEAFFAQLLTGFRQAHPSSAGDLHEAGRAFPHWLQAQLADTEYAWLADLARLEWASADAATCTPGQPVGIDVLARIAPERLAEVRLLPCTSMRWVASEWPVFSVWRANQPDADGAAVDPALGGQGVLVRATAEAPLMHRVEPALASFAGALAEGRALGEAVDVAGLPVEDLVAALAFLFTEGYVVAASLPPS